MLTLLDEQDMRALIRRGINPDDCESIGRGEWRCVHPASGGNLTFVPAAHRPTMVDRRRHWWLEWLGDYTDDKKRQELCKFARTVPNLAMRLACQTGPMYLETAVPIQQAWMVPQGG